MLLPIVVYLFLPDLVPPPSPPILTNPPFSRLSQLMAAMYGYGNRKLSVEVGYGSVPAEWQVG